jgi:hypothetical protein
MSSAARSLLIQGNAACLIEQLRTILTMAAYASEQDTKRIVH